MKISCNGIVIEGSVAEMKELGILGKKTVHIKTHDLRRNDSYPSGKRPWTAGRKPDRNSRSAKAMCLIGMPEGSVFSDLKPGSKEQKNYWRATEFLRGNASKLNLIK